MATPIDNAQLADSLFANLRQSTGRYMDAQVQIAARAEQERKQREMMNLKRVQEIQDQQTEAEMRKALVAQQVDAQRDIANLQLTRDDARMTAAEKRDEARVAADEKRRTRDAIRAAKLEYNGPEDLDKLGSEDDPATFGKILKVINAHKTKIATDSVKATKASLEAQRMALNAQLKPTDEEMGIITGNAANLYGTGEFKKSSEKYNALLNGGLSPTEALEALKGDKVNNKFVQMVEYSRAGELRNLLKSKMDAPSYRVQNEQLARSEAQLGDFALKHDVGNLLFDTAPAADAGGGEGKGDGKKADASTFGGGKKGLLTPGNIDLKKQPKVKNPNGGTSTVFSKSYNIDGKEYLLPSVSPDGRFLATNDEVLGEFKKTGRHLGVFGDVESANAAAKRIHEAYAKGLYETKDQPDVSNLAPAQSEGSGFSPMDWALPVAATPWEKIPGAVKNINTSRIQALLRLLGPRVASFGGTIARNAGPAARMGAAGVWLGDKFNDAFPNNGLAQIGRATADVIESPLEAEYARIAAERQRAALLANLTLRQ